MNEIFTTLVDTTAGLTQYAFNLLLQSTALIFVGLFVGWAMRRHGSAVQSAIYRATLVTVLVCPFAAITLNLLGFQGWTVQIPSTQEIVTYEVPNMVPEMPPPVEVNQKDDPPHSSLAFVDKGVSILAFSEFGRRVNENGSSGTDHGTAGPVFLAGSPVKGGLIGETTNLSDLDDGDLKTQFDFRRIYATLLDNWLGVPSSEVLGGKFEHLELL